MFRSSMRSSSGSSLFTSLSMLLLLKTIKIFKKYYQSIVVMWQHMFSMPVMRTVWRRELSSRLHTVHSILYTPRPSRPPWFYHSKMKTKKNLKLTAQLWSYRNKGKDKENSSTVGRRRLLDIHKQEHYACAQHYLCSPFHTRVCHIPWRTFLSWRHHNRCYIAPLLWH